MPDLGWLTARPIAHRGLHDPAAGIIENTASAIDAAIAADYAIEVDLQVTADGEAMVHHDDALGRLTEGTGALASLRSEALRHVAFKATGDRMLTLAELCARVAGRVGMVLEIKSRFDGDRRLVDRVAAVLSGYRGPAAAMSFDPAVVESLRAAAPAIPRGIVAQRRYRDAEFTSVPAKLRRSMSHLLHSSRSRPHFLAYNVKDLPALPPLFSRHLLGLPLLTWTVRTQADREIASRWADQIIFEGFRP